VQLAEVYDDDATFAESIDSAVSTSDVIKLPEDVLYQHIGANSTETAQLWEVEQRRGRPTSAPILPKRWALGWRSRDHPEVDKSSNPTGSALETLVRGTV